MKTVINSVEDVHHYQRESEPAPEEEQWTTCYSSFLWATAFRLSKSSTSTDPLGGPSATGVSTVGSEFNNVQILSPEEYKEGEEQDD